MLSLEILKDHHISYRLLKDDLLDYLVDEILESISGFYFEKLFLDKNYKQNHSFHNIRK